MQKKKEVGDQEQMQLSNMVSGKQEYDIVVVTIQNKYRNPNNLWANNNLMTIGKEVSLSEKYQLYREDTSI